MQKTKLSILIPVYNEEKTIREIIRRVKSVHLPHIKKEIIIVDDGSTDRTRTVLALEKGYKKILHEENRGKGAAVRTALQYATGDIILIQDADLEYHPKDYQRLITPLLEEKADAVFGSRILNKKNKHGKITYTLGGIFLTKLFNFLFHTTLTDLMTGYKVFKSGVIKTLPFHADRFAFESELVAKLCKKKAHILEVPISYYPRFEGKKIRWADGVRHSIMIVKQRLTND